MAKAWFVSPTKSSPTAMRQNCEDHDLVLEIDFVFGAVSSLVYFYLNGNSPLQASSFSVILDCLCLSGVWPREDRRSKVCDGEGESPLHWCTRNERRSEKCAVLDVFSCCKGTLCNKLLKRQNVRTSKKVVNASFCPKYARSKRPDQLKHEAPAGLGK